MASSWKDALRAERISIHGDEALIAVGNGRTHRVRVLDEEKVLRFEARVARPSVVKSIDDLLLNVWRRNRTTLLVGFRIAASGWLIGEAWLPKASVTDDEIVLVARTVAAECDRFEERLTAADSE